MEPRALLIEACNFVDFPLGGQLNFARQMVKAFGDRLALVGISTDETPVGTWVDKVFAGVRCKFFSVGKRSGSAKQPLVPARFSAWSDLRRYRDRILTLGVRNAFIQAPEVALAVNSWPWDHLCYRFAGVENPLVNARYPGSALLARQFDALLFRSLQRADLLLATADADAIIGMIRRSNGAIPLDKIVQFPTRVDTSVFFPFDKAAAKRELRVSPDELIIVTSGRLAAGKGWELLVEAFAQFREQHVNALLWFIGDGEDRFRLQEKITTLGLTGNVFIAGHKNPVEVARMLNAADLFVFGSLKEGWPTVLIEALACHKPIVTTDVSGARAIVREGVNGHVVGNRDPASFAAAMVQALALPDVAAFSQDHTLKYSLEFLARDFRRLWPPMQD